MGALLDIRELTLDFVTETGVIHALDKVSLHVNAGEVLALIGESGSGKSITGMAVLRLHGKNAQIGAARFSLDDQPIYDMPERMFRQIRGRKVAMIFQNAKAALNPIRRVGETLTDILLAHSPDRMKRPAARERVQEVMEQIGISHAADRMQAYPAELSGGMCQRIMIAAALVCRPDLIIADEPTSALDVTTQGKVMTLLMSACRDRGVAVVFITHDLALAGEYCDRMVVMHAGQVLETGPSADVLTRASHPYTRMLVASMPYGKASVDDLKPMEGNLPDLRRADLPACRFAERCPHVQPQCRTRALPDTEVRDGHSVRCHFPYEN